MIRIATRGSALALTQAGEVAELLGGAELVEVSSDGEAGDKSRFVRGVERALVGEYTAAVRKLVDGLSLDSFDRAVEVASLAMEVRGYEHIKLGRAAAVRARSQARHFGA